MKLLLSDLNYSKMLGVTFGNNCKLNGIPNWGSEPYLISIGNKVEISFGCSFITHDGSTWLFRDKDMYKDVIRFGKIEIGDNCFIGANSTILPGTIIKSNSIVAAGSVVTKNIPSGEIWGGNPAKFICTVDEFAEKCLKENPSYNKKAFNKNKMNEVIRIYK